MAAIAQRLEKLARSQPEDITFPLQRLLLPKLEEGVVLVVEVAAACQVAMERTNITLDQLG